MQNETVKKIQEYALEEIMGLRFGAYAKEIIQDRAIPDVRDGLKPVQRRILYDMYINHNDSAHPFTKCAKTVGDVLGKFHPHGDSSVYDAMVRMSQWWKQSMPLIDIHGNNGSIDGDGPAAYRYTEARLSKVANELLKDLDKGTVEWAPNFDDTLLEPTVLPAKFPALLVNGTNGISAGYATNIPPHNLGEIIDATIKRIDSPNCRLETILDIVKGPDFPTGGICMGKNGIIDAFSTGRGRVIVRSKYEVVKTKGKEQIIITEIPFEVNKAMMVAKIDAIRIDKKIDGIAEVRDETDRTGIRIAIDLKANANSDLIINYLLKNTDLQVSYNYNMVAIVNKRPMTLGILSLLDAYIAHQKEVITRRSKFDLEAYQKRLNIVDGFLKMMDILDEVIKTIRASKNKTDAKENLMKEFNFNALQAEAIVVLQLYRLTNTDVLALQEEHDNLVKYIKALELILSNEEKLKEVMKYELKKIKKDYPMPRRTEIVDEIVDIKLDTTDLITKENVMVALSNEGYIKRVSMKSYTSSNGDETTLKPGDYLKYLFEVSTLDNLVIFTNLGQYLYVPVHTIFEGKWKDLGKHINNLVTGLSESEYIVGAFILKNPKEKITFVTKNGLVKQSILKDFVVSRYSKAMLAFKLKDNDEVIAVNQSKPRTVLISEAGYYVNIDTEEIPVVGARASGVRGMNLKDDVLAAGLSLDSSEYLSIFTNNKTAKRVKVSELETHNRAKKGSTLIKKVKSFDYKIIKALLTDGKDELFLKCDNEITKIKNTDISILDLKSTGGTISRYKIDDVFTSTVVDSSLKNNKDANEEVKTLEENTDKVVEEIQESEIEEKKEEKPKEEQVSLNDFFDEFKI
ncbi:dNA topoisomerase IV A subunit [Mycoplasma sp. CAG:956]|nr:dNA topoisomerase IV A subunit [Mycoplasma sp. CAG:956]